MHKSRKDLIRSSCLPRANCPHWLISNDDLRPIDLLVNKCLDLAIIHLKMQKGWRAARAFCLKNLDERIQATIQPAHQLWPHPGSHQYRAAFFCNLFSSPTAWNQGVSFHHATRLGSNISADRSLQLEHLKAFNAICSVIANHFNLLYQNWVISLPISISVSLTTELAGSSSPNENHVKSATAQSSFIIIRSPLWFCRPHVHPTSLHSRRWPPIQIR